MSAGGYRQAQVCQFTLGPMLMALFSLSGSADAAGFDVILPVEGGVADRPPAVDRAEHRPLRNPRRLEPGAQSYDRPPDEHAFVLFPARRLGASESQGEDGQFGAGGIIRIRGDRRALDEVLESEAGDLGATAAARGEGGEQEGRVTPVGEPSAVARCDEPLEHLSGQGFRALASARPPGGADGEAERSAQVRRRKRALEAEPAMEGRPQGIVSADKAEKNMAQSTRARCRSWRG